MSRHHPSPPSSTGRIEKGPVEEDGLVPRTLDFIREQLPEWRDDPRRPKNVAEKGLNSSLCDFLDLKQRRGEFPMVRFKHEAPQTGRATVDIGVHGLADVTSIGVHSFSIYEPFLVIECKRLPTPDGNRREREYVSGFHKNGGPSGGLQRFKLGLHGSNVEDAAMIGYVETHGFRHWHGVINRWIDDLAGGAADDGTKWTHSDRLSELRRFGKTTASSDSMHARNGSVATPVIRVRHIWVQMH